MARIEPISDVLVRLDDIDREMSRAVVNGGEAHTRDMLIASMLAALVTQALPAARIAYAQTGDVDPLQLVPDDCAVQRVWVKLIGHAVRNVGETTSEVDIEVWPVVTDTLRGDGMQKDGTYVRYVAVDAIVPVKT